MSAVLQARPTEYKGIQFRSKSEAIMARLFDLIPWGWNYEPRHWRTACGWVPDFWLTLSAGPGFLSACVEYKPSRPTSAYLEELTRRILSIKERLYGHGALVIFANPFDTAVARGVLRFERTGDNTGDWVDLPVVAAWVDSKMEEARSFRFDLQ